MRRAHVRPHREHQASVLWIRLHPHGAFKGAGLVGSRGRGVRLLDHRVRHSSQSDAGGAFSVEGAGPRALRLPFAGTYGRDCNPRREGFREARGLTTGTGNVTTAATP